MLTEATEAGGIPPGWVAPGTEKLADRVDLLLSAIEVLPLEPPTDRKYAELRHHLTRHGTPVGPNDLLIVAHALAEGLAVVTANTRDFSRVPALSVENWLQDV